MCGCLHLSATSFCACVRACVCVCVCAADGLFAVKSVQVLMVSWLLIAKTENPQTNKRNDGFSHRTSSFVEWYFNFPDFRTVFFIFFSNLDDCRIIRHLLLVAAADRLEWPRRTLAVTLTRVSVLSRALRFDNDHSGIFPLFPSLHPPSAVYLPHHLWRSCPTYFSHPCQTQQRWLCQLWRRGRGDQCRWDVKRMKRI